MAKLKILHIITRLEAGGSTTHTIAAARAMRDKFATEILCGEVDEGAIAASTADAAVSRIPQMRREPGIFSDLAAFFGILSAVRKMKPDIIHTHTSKAGILGRWAALAANLLPPWPQIKIVHTPHGHILYGYFGPAKTRFYTALERLTALFTDKLAALSSGELEESLAAGIGSRKKWVVIPSGVGFPTEKEEAELRRKGLEIRRRFPAAAVIAGTVARLEPVKGVEYFIKAAALALKKPGPPLFFVVVGDGKEMSRLQKLSSELGIKEKVFFAGFQAEPMVWMAALDVYVQPSVNEGLGRTLIEAHYLRLPAAASRVCGIPDVVEDGGTGFLCAPKNPGELAQAICRLAADAQLRRKLGENGRLRVIGNDDLGNPRFSQEAMTAKLSALYESLC